VLDTPPEEAFDRITQLAADLFDVPTALISLVAENRQWFKCKVGFDRRETGLDISFCVHAIESDRPTVIPDATEDERVKDNPLVTEEPGVRFYAGAPLVTPDGYRIGTLCVLDTEPRHPSEKAVNQLEDLSAMVMDELELRRTRRATEEQRDVLRRSQKVARVGGWEYDPETDTARGTDELYRIIGLPEEDFTLETGLNLYAPEARPQVESAMQACIEEGTSFDLEVPLIRPDGKRREIRVRGDAERANGKTVRVTGVLQDITKRKGRERKLRTLSTAVQQANEAVVITEAAPLDPPGPQIVYVNAAFTEQTGYDEDEVLGKTPRILQGPKTDPEVLDDLRAALDAGESWEGETINYRKDGTPYVVQWNIAPVQDENGRIEHWISTQRDVTERRKIEADLREREEYLSVTLDSIGDAFIATDPNGRITAMNARAETLTGWPRADAEGRPLPEVFSISDPDTGDPVESPVQQVLRREEVIGLTMGTVLTARDGSERCIADSAAPIKTDEGDLLGVVLVFRDVTEKLQHRQELEMERQRFEMALMGGDLGLWDWNMETDEVVYNERWAEMLGYSLEEVKETLDFFIERTHPEDVERVFDAVERHARGDIPHIDLAIRLRAKDGSWRWVLDRGMIVERSDDGSPRRMVGTHLDITQRKEREEELRQRERQFRSLAEQTSDLITRHAYDGTILYASPAAERILGASPEALVGRDPYELIHPDDRAEARADHEQVLAGTRTRSELRYVRPDGEVVWMETIGSVDPSKEGPPEMIVSSRPIDERKEAEEQLKQSRERWQRLVENQQDGILITVGGTIRYANPAGARLLGADTAEEVVGRAWETFLPPGVTDTAEATEGAGVGPAGRREQIRRGEPTGPDEHEIERLDGERRTVESYAVPIEYDGERAAQTLVRDLTERKRTQRQLRQAQKMETVGQLAGGIAHDFNNILHSAGAYVEMVRDGLPARDPDRDLLERAAQGLGRAGDLVQKLLTFSRQESSEPKEAVDVGAIVRESLSLVQPSLPKSVDLRTHVEEEPRTTANPGELHQVVTNILTNAVQAMEEADPDDAVLDVDVRTLNVDKDLAQRHLGLDPGPYVRLSISDTGPGMDAETQERIFEPFFTTKEVGEGTGLGLSVVHGIVQSCGGEIVVYSEPGEGTTFDVYLPKVQGDNRPTGDWAPDGAEDAPKNARVLFVDDDPHITEMEAVRLRRIGYEVRACESADEALRVFDAAPEAVDAVITDFAMPRVDGLALTDELRARGFEGPVILMSGFSAQVAPDEMQTAGVTTYVRKPVGKAELQQTLRRVLRGTGGRAS
jgi:PAS domain S-box-containing protein